MSLNVSSFFRSKMESTNPSSIVLKFTFNGSDISGKVVRYGAVSRDITEVIGSGFVLEIENASQTFNSLMTDKTQFFQEGVFEYGFVTDAGSEDTIQLFGGELVKARFKETEANLSFRDKLIKLKKFKVGTNDNPVSFTNTEVNPADLAWWVVTSYGGLSSIKSTSNPDIDYASWLDWWEVFDDNNTIMQAQFEGEDVVEIINTIQEITDSAIYAEGNNKLYFNRWTGVTSDTLTVTDSVTMRIDMDIEGTHIVNKAKVLIGYDPTSKTWAGEVTRQNTASINSFGVFEKVFDDTSVWHVDSVSAVNLADRFVYRRKEPNMKLQIKTPLVFLDGQIGDEVLVTSEVYSLDQKPVNLFGYRIDTGKGMMTLVADEGFGKGPGRLRGFILDDDYWGLLDQDYNPLL